MGMGFDDIKELAEKGDKEYQYIYGLFLIGCQNEKGYEYIEKSAKQGYPEAIQFLGQLYCNGSYTQQDYKKAFELYNKSIDAGNLQCNYDLGLLYLNGHGVEKNIQKAIECFEIAAINDNYDARLELGMIYYEGKYVKQDYKKAFNYFKSSATVFCFEGYYRLGICYYTGSGVEQDYKKALDNFVEVTLAPVEFEFIKDNDEYIKKILKDYYGIKANHDDIFDYYEDLAELGYEEIQMLLAKRYNSFGGATGRRNVKKAIKFYKMAADNGNAEAQLRLGQIYFEQYNSNDDFYYFSKAAEQNNKEAMYWVGWCYEIGRHCEKNINKAIEYYNKAIELGYDEFAKSRLSQLYFEGKEVEKDYNKVFKYEKDIDTCPRLISSYLSACYYYGLGTPVDYDKAYEVANRLKDHYGNYSAFIVANCYYYGHGVEQDYNKAFNYYKLAAKYEFKEAVDMVVKCYTEGIGIRKNKTMAEKYKQLGLNFNYFLK